MILMILMTLSLRVAKVLVSQHRHATPVATDADQATGGGHNPRLLLQLLWMSP